MKKKPTPKPKNQPCPLDGINGQLMVMAAHRYCLGRQSYIVGSCQEWLRQWWHKSNDNTRKVIVRDTVEVLQDGIAGSEYDEQNWREFAEWAFAQMQKADKHWCKDAVAHRNKPWPLSTQD